MLENQQSDKTKNQDFYRRLRARITAWAESKEGASHKWADILLLAPDLFYLLIRLAADPDVPMMEKAKLAAATAYFISPMDFLPEFFLGPVGFMDDIVLTAYALNSILIRTDPEIIRRHWMGQEDILFAIRHIVDEADRIIGSGLVKKIRKLIK